MNADIVTNIFCAFVIHTSNVSNFECTKFFAITQHVEESLKCSIKFFLNAI